MTAAGARTREPNDTGFVVAMLLCLAFGAMAVEDGCTGYRAARREASFAQAPGQIEATRLVEKGRNTRRHAWHVYVSYRFTVAGKPYTGSAYSAKEEAWYRGSHDGATAEIQRIERAPGVTVHYDPANPRVAVLSRQSVSGERGGIALGIGFVAAGFGVAGFMWWRHRRRSDRST